MDERRGVILNYGLGIATQNPKICLIKVLEVEPSEAKRMAGWRVCWPASTPKLLGRIVSLHGRNGVLRVRFAHGVPGQALGTQVRLIPPHHASSA